MFCQSSNQVPFFAEQSPSLSVSRIELFVIPALAIDSAGFRVCLRVTSNQGYGWSELFVNDNEDMFDLDRCSDLLVSFIGSIVLSTLNDYHYDKTNQDGRIFNCFTDAVNHIAALTADSAQIVNESEEFVLRQRAIHYVSLN